MTKRSTFVEAVRGEMFQNVITQAKDLLSCSVDEAVNCLNNGLLEAAACMKRRVSKGLKSSKWFDVECKAVRRETRKWWRKFRRSKCEESKSKNRLLYVNCRKSFRNSRLFHRLKIGRFSGSLAELFLAPPHSCSVSGI